MNKRNICITDCKTFEEYQTVAQVLEGYTPAECARCSIEEDMKLDPLLYDDGEDSSFMYFWEPDYSPNLENCRRMTMQEFYDEFCQNFNK